jgi:hypothetical protein
MCMSYPIRRLSTPGEVTRSVPGSNKRFMHCSKHMNAMHMHKVRATRNGKYLKPQNDFTVTRSLVRI